MRRRISALLASLFSAIALVAVLAPIGAGLASDSPPPAAGTAPTVSSHSGAPSPTGTIIAGRRWN